MEEWKGWRSEKGDSPEIGSPMGPLHREANVHFDYREGDAGGVTSLAPALHPSPSPHHPRPSPARHTLMGMTGQVTAGEAHSITRPSDEKHSCHVHQRCVCVCVWGGRQTEREIKKTQRTRTTQKRDSMKSILCSSSVLFGPLVHSN